MRFSRRLPGPTLAVAVLLACSTAQAAIVVRVGVEDLTDTATVIVRGRVLESKARWTSDHSTINTYVRIAVDEVLKGSAGGEVLVTCFGGTVGGDRIPVRGVPVFRKGETVVVFLWRNRHGDLLPLGLNQGKFTVEKDPVTGRLVARNSLQGLALVPRRPGTKVRKKPDVLPLDTLRDRIRRRLRAREEEKEKKPEVPAKTSAEDAGGKEKAAGAPEGTVAPKPGKARPPPPAATQPPEKQKPPETAPPGAKESPGAAAGDGKEKPRKPEKPPPETDPEKK